MARPVGGYKLKDGTRVPGASTIAKIGSDPGGLIHWSWEQGIAGIDYRDARDAAGKAGTLVHEAAENWKHGRPQRGPMVPLTSSRRRNAAIGPLSNGRDKPSSASSKRK